MTLNVDVPRLLYMLRIRDARLRSGKEWWARCPFPGHSEIDPSWSIRDDAGTPSHGFHKCFGCKKGGGPVSLVQMKLGITASSAKRWLQENGLIRGRALGAIPELKVVVGRPRNATPGLPLMVRQEPLERWPSIARKYALGRGITPQHVLRYRLGYVVQGELAGRIVLPAYDTQGRVTNYTARSFVDDAKRYLNPKKSEGYPFHLSVFGEHLWSSLPPDTVFTTEGAINALAIDTALGGRYAVGALYGSELNPPQVLKMTKFPNVIHVADPDFPGREFAYRIEAAIRRSTNATVIELEDNDAADTPTHQLKEILHDAL